MANAKGVIDAFRSFWKSRQATIQPVGMEFVAPPSEDFMPICLMANVPHKLVVGGIENVMQSHRKLNNAQAGPEMAAIHRDIVNNELPQFVAELHQLNRIQLFEVIRGIYLGQKFTRCYEHLLSWWLFSLKNKKSR